ncbi:MAG: TRAP transporter small permease subunit [Fimbriimonadaceae bacterium]|nr:TRAP transporter small permease subunit [Alphaproteobacteria bacterium]
MRAALNFLYKLSGALGALFLTLILVSVLAQVSLNIADRIAKLFTGSPIGLLIPSYADFAGYFLAAGTFFALAYSFNHGAHIRVNLLLIQFPESLRRLAEVWSSAIAFAMSAYFTYWAADLMHDSWRFGDVSTGLVSIKLWIPQLTMVAGLCVLTIATLDALVQNLTGRQPAYLNLGPDAEILDQKIELGHE